jgi:uncharacterized protein (TIGR00288 family)
MFEFFRKKNERKNLAVFIDGPNIIRKEFSIDLDKLRTEIEKTGRIRSAKVFLNQYAPNKLIEAVMSQGFKPEFGLGEENNKEGDIDVYMAVEAMEAIYDSKVDAIVLVTRDADFLPVIQKAKEKGKEVIVVGVEPGFSIALRNSADKVIMI